MPDRSSDEEQQRRAADGQQPLSVTIREPARRLLRIMTADTPVDGH
jgi:hypothetical protein